MTRTRTSRDLPEEPNARLERLVVALSDPGAYPRHVEEVTHLETHISVLFFAGDRVYKLKKPVVLDFLDYSELETRRRFCEEEVRLNRRLSPRMYLGIVPVVQEKSGAITIDGDGEIVDWVVEMIRLPAERMLDALLEKGGVEPAVLERIAIVLARFHERAATGPAVNHFGLAAEVAGEILENVDQLEQVARERDLLPTGALDYVRGRVRAFTRDQRDLLERRIAQWRIREGHGDLHAGNVCLAGDEVYVYDCVEFDRGFRCGDVASDLAFLAMDLDHRGHPEAADHFVRAYARIADDADLERLVAFYRTHRALVRAKVQVVTARDESIDADGRRAASEEAVRFAQLALGYELAPSLVLTLGLPASGKSYSARYLAGRLRAQWLRSDVVRDTLLSDEATNGKGQRYSDESRERVYGTMLEHAREALERGRSVVVDATFSRRDFRGPFLELADRLGVPLCVLVLEVDDDVARERMELRANDPHEPSEADFAVYLEEKQRFEPPSEVREEALVHESGARAPAAQAHEVLARLLPQAAAPSRRRQSGRLRERPIP